MTQNLTFGGLAFGIPIKLKKSRDEDRISFRQGCSCGTPITQVKTCPKCNKEVPYAELEKLYETDNGFIKMDKTKLPKLEASDVHIETFLDIDTLTKIYHAPFGVAVGEYYFVGFGKKTKKDKKVQETLSVIASVMKERGLIGIGKVVLRSKEHLVALMSFGNALYVATLFYPHEVRENEWGLEQANTLNHAELSAFLEKMRETPKDDFWKDSTKTMIEALIAGKEPIEQVEVEPETDLFAAIRAEVKTEKNIEVSK